MQLLDVYLDRLKGRTTQEIKDAGYGSLIHGLVMGKHVYIASKDVHDLGYKVPPTGWVKITGYKVVWIGKPCRPSQQEDARELHAVPRAGLFVFGP